ncbi:probable copper-transporting ATPase HMA5, partial [Tanacetum coccineum]
VDCIIFDKTETLTIGKPLVVNSQHPLAKAVEEYAKKFKDEEENPVWAEARKFESIMRHVVQDVG